MNRTLTEDEAFEVAGTYIPRIVHADRVSYAILDQDDQFMQIESFRGLAGELKRGVRIPVEGSTVGESFKEGRLINSPDLTKVDAFDTNALVKAGLRSGLVVPIVVGGTVFGDLSLRN